MALILVLGRALTEAYLALDPGWTQTDMVGPGATVPLADSVQGLMKVLTRVPPEDRGSLWHYDGTKTELFCA